MTSVAKAGRLAGRTALITGASRGIGRAIALRYAEEGANLFLVATNGDKLAEVKATAEALGVTAWLHCADVSDRAAVEAMVAAAISASGGIDVLVNNAGVYKAARITDYSFEDFDRIMKVNVYGAFHVMQLVLRHMQARRSGKVVNIASTAGKAGSMNQGAYNASKHAVVGLTRCAALEMGAYAVNVNAICPGFVETDMIEGFREHSNILGVPFEKVMEAGLARVPLKRFLQPKEVADLAVYLGSGESDGMTGQSILIDGGLQMI